MRVSVIPHDGPDCGWYATLSPPGPARRLQGRHETEWAVVGAGFTGLAAARRVAEHQPGARVLLIEAQSVGLGASGRNSGFVVELGRYHERFGPEINRRLVRLGRAGIDRLRQLVRQHGIECQWQEGGRLHVAVGDRGRRSLDLLCRRMQEIGEPCQRLDAQTIAGITGTTYYCAAAHTPGDVQVQPAALVRGLAASLPMNVELYEDSPVHAAEFGQCARLECPQGSVRARRLLLATNAFTPAWGLLRRRVFPMLTFGSLTRPLRDRERAALGGQPEWGLISAERVGCSVRRTRDGRILIRSMACYGYQISPNSHRFARIRQSHQELLRARFPALRELQIEYTWGGVMSMSANEAPYFGQPKPGIFVLAGDNGHGIAMATAAGELLADLAVGYHSNLLDDLQQLPAPSWLPPNPLLRLGVQATSHLMHWRARSEL